LRTLTLDDAELNGPLLLAGYLRAASGQPLKGNGDVLLSWQTSDRPTVSSASGSLTIGAGLVIHGEGDVNVSGALINHGRISADKLNGVLSVRGQGIQSTGVLEAINGGRLSLNGAYRIDQLGTVTANGGVVV